MEGSDLQLTGGAIPEGKGENKYGGRKSRAREMEEDCMLLYAYAMITHDS